MVEENLKEATVKTIAISPKSHASLIALKNELKIKKMDELIIKLVTEYEQNRK
jgi:hypothetical protein